MAKALVCREMCIVESSVLRLVLFNREFSRALLYVVQMIQISRCEVAESGLMNLVPLVP